MPQRLPALWRWSFFPIWAFAEAYIFAVHAGPWPINVISFVAPLAGLGIVGAIWIAIVLAIARAGGVSF